MKVVLIMQARMGAERLPGKVLKTVLGKPLLKYELSRLSKAVTVNEIVVATTTSAKDEPIVEFCRQEKVACFRGDEQDVLSRYYEAAKKHSADVVIRATADCPLIDPAVADKTVNFYLKNQDKYDYVSNVLKRTYPRGMDCEVFSFKVLEEAHRDAKKQPEREHVTQFIYNHPERFRLGSVEYSKDASGYRLTVDTPEDFKLIEKIITHFGPAKPNFSLEEVLSVLEKNPEWAHINQHIEQKA